jgi:hypothetical protein
MTPTEDHSRVYTNSYHGVAIISRTETAASLISGNFTQLRSYVLQQVLSLRLLQQSLRTSASGQLPRTFNQRG